MAVRRISTWHSRPRLHQRVGARRTLVMATLQRRHRPRLVVWLMSTCAATRSRSRRPSSNMEAHRLVLMGSLLPDRMDSHLQDRTDNHLLEDIGEGHHRRNRADILVVDMGRDPVNILLLVPMVSLLLVKAGEAILVVLGIEYAHSKDDGDF